MNGTTYHRDFSSLSRMLTRPISRVLLLMLIFSLCSSWVAAAEAPPTIASDKADYAPGETVTLSGTGWAPSESVRIIVNDTIGQSWQRDVTVTASDAGTITDVFQLPSYFVSNYDVTAIGPTSGTATTTFTDLSIGTYDQCSNDDGDGYASGDAGCRWINGNLQSNNSIYFEGDATVQRLWLTQFAPGSTHTVTLKYGTTKGGKHAYDFLTTWDWSEDWISEADRCQDITGCTTASENSLDIPQDPNVPNSFEPSAPGERQFKMRGGTLNSATTPTVVSGTYAGDSETVITLSFTVANSGPMCASSGCDIALWFGAHVAAQANWGLGLGAGSISGSPYHVALEAVDNASVGQRDNQMQANVVTFIPNGTIVIVKDAVPNSAQDFSFNLNNNSTIAQNFSLDDDADATLPNSQTFSVPPGTWTASELNIPSGWSLTNLTCVDPSNNTTVSGATATIALASNETVTCTFTNSRDSGSLTLTKALSGGPSGYTGPFTINYDCGTGLTGSKSISAGSSETITGIPSGTSCTVSEPTLPSAPTGYTFGTPTFSPSATVTVGASTTVEVTTNNTLTRDTGSLKLSKSLSGGPSGYTGPFTINYDCGTGFTGSVSVEAGSSETISGIPTGTSCTISETLPTPPEGYSFGTPSFSPSATVTITTKGATVEVTTNNTLTRNTGTLTIAKTLSNPDGASVPSSFTINYDCGTGYTGSVSVAAGGSQTVSGIPTGSTCTVSEAALTPIPGYTWEAPSVSPSSVVIADTTSTFTLTVANAITRDTGSLKLSKSLSGGPAGYTGPFTINYDCDGSAFDGSVSVSAGSSQTINNIPTGTSCTISETLPTPPEGYSFGTPSFSPSATVTITTKDATVEVTTNNTLTRDTGSFKITKTTSNPDGATLPATFTGTYDCGTGYTGTWSVANGSSQTVDDIPTGNICSVTEDTPDPIAGYTWGTPTFTPATIEIGSKNGTFEIVVRNSITRDTGSLEIVKTLSNPDGASVPASFTVNYDCGTGYTGQVNVAPGSPATINNIPTGSVCTVSEVAPAAISGYTWGTVTYSPSSVTISDKGETFTITVGNSITRDRGSFTITKTTSNPDGATLPSAFTGTYNCGTGYTGTWSVANGDSQTVSGIPTGNICSVTEDALDPIAGYTWGTPTFTPATIEISSKGGTFEIVVGNSITRDRGSLKITKTLSNPDGAIVPASFTVNYDCGTGYTGSVSVAPGSLATINNIPTGSVCTVSEVTPTAISGYTWGTVTYSPSSVTISDKGETFTIAVGNSITRDRGSLTIVKKVVNDNGGTATVSAFGINSSAGSLTFDSGVANGTTTTYTSQKITVTTGSYTLKESDVYGYTEGTWSCTGAAGTVVDTFNNGSVVVGKGEDVVCTITNNDQPGTIVVIKNAKPAQGSFAFTTTGTGYSGFTLTGATTNNGNRNSQILNAGTYTVKESTQLSWILTGIGGSTDPTKPYNCVVTGSGGSTGLGDLNTQTATISLKNGDTVTCTFENTGNGATRTQGFWATHPQLAQIAWFGGTAYGHTFPGVSNTAGINDMLLCGTNTAPENAKKNIDTLAKLMGGFWSSVSTKTTGAKRSSLDQSRMQLLQQLLAAELNASAFGSTPINGSFAAWEKAYCGTDAKAIQTAQQQAASFNSNGDSSTFTPGTSANSKYARSIADLVFWNILP